MFQFLYGYVLYCYMRIIWEVCIFVICVIIDVYYVDGIEVERKVIEEIEELIVECQECEIEVFFLQIGGFLGDLGDISFFFFKVFSLYCILSGISFLVMYSSGSLGKGVGLFKGKISGIEFVDFVLFSF